MKNVQAEAGYKMDYEKTKDKNKFDVTATPQYSDQKKAEKMSSDVSAVSDPWKFDNPSVL